MGINIKTFALGSVKWAKQVFFLKKKKKFVASKKNEKKKKKIGVEVS